MIEICPARRSRSTGSSGARWARLVGRGAIRVAALLLLLAQAAFAADGTDGFSPGRLHPDAPPETEQFGRLAGIWDVTMSIRQEDGSWPKPEEALRAEWRFHYILDGWAVQDEWIAPPSDQPAGDGPRQLGTNIRIYDPEAGHWEIAWISNTQKTLSTLEAVAENGRIVMTGTHPSGRPQRVTFHDVTEDSFDWKMELQGVGEDPETWTEVARIRAERKAGKQTETK